jgi:hypothetical protein
MITIDFAEKIYPDNNFALLRNMLKWCYDHMGPYSPDGRWHCRAYAKFSFRNQADAVMFLLRWGK